MANELAQAMVRAVFGGIPNADVDELLQSSDAGSRFFVALSQAVHDFLGVERGKELRRDAWAKLVAALRAVDAAPLDYGNFPDEDHLCDEALALVKEALRAAGEEVE